MINDRELLASVKRKIKNEENETPKKVTLVEKP